MFCKQLRSFHGVHVNVKLSTWSGVVLIAWARDEIVSRKSMV